jgi:hypothetical protein
MTSGAGSGLRDFSLALEKKKKMEKQNDGVLPENCSIC